MAGKIVGRAWRPNQNGSGLRAGNSEENTGVTVVYALASVHPETPDETLAVSDSERRHFSSWRVQFGASPFPDCPAPHRKVQEIKGLRGGDLGSALAATHKRRRIVEPCSTHIAGPREGSPHKKTRRLTPPGRKMTLSGWKPSQQHAITCPPASCRQDLSVCFFLQRVHEIPGKDRQTCRGDTVLWLRGTPCESGLLTHLWKY